jgi:hypothetical protein
MLRSILCSMLIIALIPQSKAQETFVETTVDDTTAAGTITDGTSNNATTNTTTTTIAAKSNAVGLASVKYIISPLALITLLHNKF